MAEYLLKISGVHYGANGDFVAGQKDTEEMHVRTRELLSWIDSSRPIVTLSPDPTNHIHEAAIQARAMGKRIGRVAFECVDKAWEFLLSPIPAFRPSHCPTSRISNAASSRQAIIISAQNYIP